MYLGVRNGRVSMFSILRLRSLGSRGWRGGGFVFGDYCVFFRVRLFGLVSAFRGEFGSGLCGIRGFCGRVRGGGSSLGVVFTFVFFFF